MNDDSIPETAKLPNSIRLSTVEKKTKRKNGHDTFVPPKTDAKEEKIPTETEVLSKTPEYPHLKEKAKPINLKPISGLEQLNDDLMQLKQVRPVQMNATITPPPVSKDSSNLGNPTTESKWSISYWANLVKLIRTTILRQFLTKICRFN